MCGRAPLRFYRTDYAIPQGSQSQNAFDAYGPRDRRVVVALRIGETSGAGGVVDARLETRKCFKLGRLRSRSTISMPGFMTKAPSPINTHTGSFGAPMAMPAPNIEIMLIEAPR